MNKELLSKKIFRLLRAVYLFYKNYMLFAITISLWSAFLLYKYGFIAINAIFWLKTGTSVLAYFFIKEYKKNEFYYFMNLGFSINRLWIITWGIDLIILILLMKQAYALR